MPQTYRFADFELDLDAQQLRLRGQPLRIERRPMDLLVMLVTRHGRLVTRDEIIAGLWPGNVVIEFDAGVNTLVRKVRRVLGDSPDEPRFVETVPGRGYRFIAPVTPTATVAPESPPPAAAEVPRKRPRWVASIVLAALLAAGAAAFWQTRAADPEQIRIAAVREPDR